MRPAVTPVGDLLPLRAPTTHRIVSSKLPKLTAILSGGQCGVDAAGLRAAVRLGLATGGRAPLGWRTLDGPAPWLGTDYGLVESWSPAYPPRTVFNVFASCATVRIASDFSSSGEICTLKAIKKYDKPYFDVDFNDVPEGFVDFLIRNGVKILNVTGGSERTSAGIGAIAEIFLFEELSK